MIIIPPSELSVAFSRSGGPGGQNVNKVSSRVQLRWHVGRSTVVSEEQKALIRQVLASRLTGDDEIMIDVDTSRSQEQNRGEAIDRLQTLVTAALTPKKKRRATRPTYTSKLKRLESKKIVSVRKQTRKKIAFE